MKRLLIGLIALAALAWAGFSLMDQGFYGLTLFMLFPVLLGALPVWVLGATTGSEAAGWGAATVLAGLLFLLALATEGVICALMAMPLALPLGALGGWLVYRARKMRFDKRTAAVLLIMPPATFTWDVNAPPEIFEVRTAIEVAATPEQVWRHVVTFSDLPEPTDWLFRSGLAYPKRARIEGSGVGAIRYCEFSTGPFVEPIEVWDEPRLLRFSVTQNPAPMHEWSLYGEIHPKHLHGYMVSKRGQFRLIPLPDGRTKLEGTTWYQHGLWPAQYWRWWSDAIIHRIHLRVLTHVRTLAETTTRK